MSALPPPLSASRRAVASTREKRERILNAARALCQSRGFDGTQMDAIASHAGVSKGTLYNFFASKEQLFADMLMQGYEEYRRLLPGLDRSDVDVRTRLTALLDGLTENYDTLATHILISHQAWSISLHSEACRAQVFEALQRFYSDFQRALERTLVAGVESGVFRDDLDAPMLASVFIGMLDGLLYRAGFADADMLAVCGRDGARRAFDWLLDQISVAERTGEAAR